MICEGKIMEYYPDFQDEEEGGLVRLSRVKYQLSEGQPDAMGWRVADTDGVEFGTVSDLLADIATGQIIFAAVMDYGSGRTTLIPVEGMYLDMTDSVVVVPARQSDVRRCPEFTEETVDVMPYVEYWLRLAAV
ncbi:MAG: PRC-barrel domain-containing protein [Armatimonadetes bacterium]|nr:PRC-barrel domain-containing protein [Armatimonadota bacterium]